MAVPEGEGPVLILGGLGLVGSALRATAAGEVVRALGKADADVSDPDSLARALDEHRPRAVINCAVFQPVDLCESEPEKAFQVNASGAGVVARACDERDIALTHFSSDYVFGGDRQRPYRESDRPDPLSIYAASKLAGEHLVLAASRRHRVVRTSAVFGPTSDGHGLASFVDRMLARARDGEATRVVDDQIVSPTYSVHLAGAVWALLERPEGGIFHVGGGGECSWYELARRLFRAVGREDLLRPTTSEEFGAPARRPAYSALDNTRLRALGIADLPSWEDGLAAYLTSAYPDL